MMKHSFLLSIIYLFLLNSTVGQKNLSLAFNAGLNVSQYEFGENFVEPFSSENIKDRNNLGYSFGLHGELPINQKQSLIFGVSSLRINNYPNLDYGFWYGLVIREDNGGNTYLNPSYLQRLQFDLIEFPLNWRYYFTKGTKMRPYMGLGMTTSFSWRERERWKSMLYQEQFINIDEGHLYEYEATDKDIRHFRTALTLNLGSSFKLNDQLNLLIDLQSNVIEHRQKQESKVTDWIDPYWEIGTAYWSQLSMNVGLQRNF